MHVRSRGSSSDEVYNASNIDCGWTLYGAATTEIAMLERTQSTLGKRSLRSINEFTLPTLRAKEKSRERITQYPVTSMHPHPPTPASGPRRLISKAGGTPEPNHQVKQAKCSSPIPRKPQPRPRTPNPPSPMPIHACITRLSLFLGYIRLPRTHGERKLNPCSHHGEQDASLLAIPTPCNVDDEISGISMRG